MFRVMGSMMPYRNRAYDIYRRNFSEASAVGFLSAILFTVFSEPVKNLVDFGEKWMELSGIPYQMNIAMFGFIVGYGSTKMFLLMRMQLFKMLLAYQGWMFNPKSTTTKMWALMLGLLRGNGKYPCFYFEPLLPRLPIPDLNATLDRFLASMKPILSDEDFIELLTATETFRVNEGPKLQQYLKNRSINKRNWVEDFWLQMAYLGWREPSAINVNCYAVDRKTVPTTNQLARAANIIYSAVKYYEEICEDTLVPQYMQDLIPLTMDGYRKTHCTTRIPKVGMDDQETHKDQKHIVIYRKGVYFKLDVYKTDSDGKEVQLTVPEIYVLLQQVLDLAEDAKDFCPVGVFTAQNRDYWAKIRERLVAVDVNRESITSIDSSIGLFVIEEECPKGLDEEAIFTMTGHGPNRYFDKSLQYIIYSNGKAGINAEHSCGDATYAARMWEYILAVEKYNNDGGVAKISDQQLKKLSPPQKLDWDLNDFEQELTESQEHFQKLANSFGLRLVFAEYGKGYIKTKRVSPDGYLQMAIQLAYYKLHGKVVKTYESASTRMFANGRTETIRPVTEASAAWCKAMSSMKTTREQKILLLKRAINAQTKVKNEAVCGQGWDRHLFGLYACCKELGMDPPALFQNKNFFMPDVLSTSQTPTKYTHIWKQESSCLGGGFAPVNPNGYGVSYIIVGEDIILFHVSSNKYSTETSEHKMSEAILDAMNEMKSLLD
ncbi:carnitine O-palmitoyltransferase 1, liver isoform-like [Mercenaria mercenaria]|uniref:carnitine O-palmitoyltransferase 1, liver isoform-like n=1 Tax=Mercenaria mercenaria TaxID=6596 RepID=UPI00234EFCCA|nr:carnitine O-palmitoyltransferase 1, liver isoform-like [Mercenaria mercenaria]